MSTGKKFKNLIKKAKEEGLTVRIVIPGDGFSNCKIMAIHDDYIRLDGGWYIKTDAITAIGFDNKQ